MSSDDVLPRWRLMLGENAGLGDEGLDADDLAADAALSWLYDRDPELDPRDVRGTASERELTVPQWLDEVHRLFPKETIERIERDAVERYELHEVVTNPEVLQRLEPSPTLLKAVLRTKHLMNAEVLALARQLVGTVVKKLMDRIATTTRRSFSGVRQRRRSQFKIAKNFDARLTVRANLGRWNRDQKRIAIEQPIFLSRARRTAERWQVILLVDESASMLGSVIHAAVTAACLWNLPGMKTHLCIFDTEVVDLTADVTDPVEILMRIQLGGGTDIGRAVAYAAGLIESPRRAIVVIVSDLYEGTDGASLVRRVKTLCEAGTIVLGLAALDENAAPVFDRDLARELVNVGAHVGAMTPGELVAFLAEKIRA